MREHLRALATENLPPNSPVPSERELSEQFGVSRMTVRQAVDALVVEGLLVRVQGSGTYVARPKVDVQVRLTSYTEEMRRRGMTPSTRLLAWEQVAADPHVADALEIEVGALTIHLHRLRLADDEPMAVSYAWVPADLVPDFADRGAPASLYAALEKHGVLPEWGEDTVDAGLANTEEARLLGVPKGSSVLRIQRRAFAHDRAVEYSRTAYRPDRYTLWVPVARPRQTYVRRSRRK